jgi:hypothetical protein
MNIINISFTGINANRQAAPRGNVSISNNVKVESVEETKLGAGEARQAYKVMFSFKTQYIPNFAVIELKGEVLILDSSEEVSKMMAQWNKEKKLDVNAARTILNNIMNRCALEVILLSRELGLPSPIPLPSIKAEGAAQAKPAEKSVEKADKSEKATAKPKKK